MENFIEWIATGVRLRDRRAVALLTSWPTDFRNDDELTRSYFRRRRPGVASPGITVLLGEDGQAQNMLTREQKCFYQNPSFYPRLTAGEWSRTLGTEIARFSEAEWEQAANQIDSDRSIRDAADSEADHHHAVHAAYLKEMGL